MKSATPCNLCHATDFWTSYGACTIKTRMDRDGLCFDCAFWSEIVDEPGPHLVVNGWHYQIGTGKQGQPFNGMSGRRFDIRYADGHEVTTYDLWCQGEIPALFRPRLPDTAQFVNGASRHTVAGTVCWNASIGRSQ